MADDSEQPYVWVLDSEKAPLANCTPMLEELVRIRYMGGSDEPVDWSDFPDAILVSAELRGGARGRQFAELVEGAGGIPIIAVARLRSLAQALSFFRNGASDYLSLPLDPAETSERLAAAITESTRRAAMSAVMLEVETVRDETPATSDDDIAVVELDEVIRRSELAEGETAEEAEPGEENEKVTDEEPEEEPEAVDGLPIPTMWEELPCGLAVFDSNINLVFCNSLALDLFGCSSLAELQEALENNRQDFAAHAVNHKPLPDNQWPHNVAHKTKTARSAVVSIRKNDRRRTWLRIDCLPHVGDGKMSRLTMTVVNVTGEMPPLAEPGTEIDKPRAEPKKDKNRRSRKAKK